LDGKETLAGQAAHDAPGSGTGDSKLNPDGSHDVSLRPGAADGLRNSPGSGGRERELPGTAAEGTGRRRKILGLDSLSISELTNLVHRKGVDPPSSTVTLDLVRENSTGA